MVDSETLWNAVQASEKIKDARLAKELKIAFLPG
ncbi:MobA/MobL family protein [Erwinia sp. ErVv1]|nr:MobA/MobL family protein [Erwinia sp. ErVv1]